MVLEIWDLFVVEIWDLFVEIWDLFEIWCLRFGIYLKFGYCFLGFIFKGEYYNENEYKK